MKAELCKLVLESTYMYCTASLSSLHYVKTTAFSDTRCPLITVSDLTINLLYLCLHPQAAPFFFKLFSYQNFLFYRCQNQ